MKRVTLVLSLVIFMLTLGGVGMNQQFGTLAYAASKELPKEGEEGYVPPPEFEYLQLKTLTLPIISDRGVTQQVSLVISLELPYGNKEEIAVYEPRLADAYLQDLYGALGSGRAMMKGSLVDIQAVKERLAIITTKVLPPEKKVNSVLLQVVQQSSMASRN